MCRADLPRIVASTAVMSPMAVAHWAQQQGRETLLALSHNYLFRGQSGLLMIGPESIV